MVLKGLKTNKARDTEGLARTIFKTPIIGTNMKESLLKLFNNMKSKGEIPEFMRRARVATIPKKGSKLQLKNYHMSSVRKTPVVIQQYDF